jgi:hypothetical protein
MWFSSKGDYYLPRYAHSDDGIKWTRTPGEPSIKPSESGPDQEMICYPVVLKHQDRLVMYYNGNAYGKEGACLAIGTSE